MAGDGRQQPVQAQNYLGDIPPTLDFDTQNLLAGIINQLQQLSPDPTAPGPPTGLSATAATLGNLIKWSPVQSAASYRVYRGSTNNIAAAVVVQQLSGNANTSWYDPFMAAAAAGQYYWVAAVSGTGVPGPTSAMLTITAGINVNDIFAQNITATGTITGALIRTAASGARIQIDSTNGLVGYDGSGNALTQLTTGGLFTMVTAAGTAQRLAIDASGIRGYDNSNNLITQIATDGSISTTGLVGTSILGGLNLAGDSSGASRIFVSDTGGTIFCYSGSSQVFTMTSSALTALNSAVFTGNGSGLTTLNGSNVSSGTVGAARIDAAIARVAMGAQNLTFTSGYGIASSGTSFAVVTTDAQIYQSSTLVANFNTTDCKLMIGGTLYTLSVIAGVVHAT